MAQVLPGDEIQDQIYLIRGVQVMMDKDLASLYEVETGALKRAVKRNIERFPEDFMFELTKAERETLRCQIGISKVENLDNLAKKQETLRCQIGTSKVENSKARGGDRFAPFVFTEPGVAMLSSVLRSDRAIQVNIAIMRVFIQLRRQKDSQTESLQKFQILENRMDEMNRRIVRLEGRTERENQSSLDLSQKDQVAFTGHSTSLELSESHGVDRAVQIQKQVSKYFQLGVNDLVSESRIRELVFARQIAIYLIRENLGLAFREIGKHFQGRDHTTIMHSYKKVILEIKKNKVVQKAIFSIQKIISENSKMNC